MSENVAKAELREIRPGGGEGKRVQVQFNPETLKVSFTNQVVPPANSAAGGGASPASGNRDQRGTSATQFVGKGTTKLSVQLWFDVTAVLPQDKRGTTDVRELTKDVAFFITPAASADDPDKYVPPGVSFIWGTFKFDGIMESMEESLELFSIDGEPLRASVTVSLSQQGIEFAFNRNAGGARQTGGANTPGGTPPGTRPLTQARSGSTVQGMAAGLGRGANWQDIAAANQIENPRLLAPGQLIDLNVRVARKS
jgi:Contractile injection system tube protein